MKFRVWSLEFGVYGLGAAPSVDYDGIVASKFGGLRDQIYNTYSLEVDFVWAVDF